MFSKIASKIHGEANSLYKIRDELRRSGKPICDLISGNINEQDFLFPQEILEEALLRGSRRCQIYRPDSFGQRPAREAISEHYRNSGCEIHPDSVLITPGTSLSYWYCFRLLADEGDEILCPCPSYPLLDYIALLSGIKLIPYRLQEAAGWRIDLEHLEACISTRTRALVLISPHNPTGHVSSSEEIDGLAEIAARHNLAIISDEVFSEFLMKPESLPRAAGTDAPLIITLNGFSKMFALPGLKFGWMAVTGSRVQVAQAVRSLELISDTFLPVSETAQAAAPEIFLHGRSVAEEFAERIRECWKISQEHLMSCRHWTYTPPEGGFYLTLRLQDIDEERAAETILREHGTLIHPGYFYDMDPDHLILCFVQKHETIHNYFPGLTGTLEKLAGQLGTR